MELKDISIEVVEALKKENMNLTHLWLLTKAEAGDLVPLPELKALERRVFILSNEITETGKEFLTSLLSNKTIDKKSKDEINEAFDKWWGVKRGEGVFPASDNFIHKGRSFQGIRNLKTKKEDCKAEFRKIVLSGEYTTEEILQGTTNHINVAKEESFKKKENKLSFITNSERYLRLRAFSPFIKTPDKENANRAEEFTGTNF